MTPPTLCPKCNAELPAITPLGLCPKCLLLAGVGPTSEGGPEPTGPLMNGSAPVGSPAASSFVPPQAAALAEAFPQLEIISLLGFGGMGAVYQARQRNLDRMVALKIIRPEASDDATFTERFNREAKTLARLNHPHIVGIYDFGEVAFSSGVTPDGRTLYYFLMEYVEGANLRQLIATGQLTPEQALAIVPQICEALQYAHDEGVVHRDIKPENILLDKRGRVKIADFGLAKLSSHTRALGTLTATRQVMGTPRYMAPEQMDGAHDVDHRADIYSLGVVFYEMLTGQVPVGYFDPPSKKVQVDVRLDEVVLRTLAREPDRRYQHASEVKIDVEGVSSSKPVNDIVQSHHASGGEPEKHVATDDAKRRGAATHETDALLPAAERQRAEELAEITPDWLGLPFLGLFATGWLFARAMWNFGRPGATLGLLAMTGITYGVVRWRMRYLPKLQAELARESRWSRVASYVVAGAIFAGGIACLAWLHVSISDTIGQIQLALTSDTHWAPLAKEEYQQVLEKAQISAWADKKPQILPEVWGFSMFPVSLPLIGLTAVAFLFLSVATLLHTRRYRYTWKYWWSPSISIVFYLVIVVALFQIFPRLLVTLRTVSPREVRCNIGWDNLHESFRDWKSKHGYESINYFDGKVAGGGTMIGTAHSRTIRATSWFNRIQTSWSYSYIRPRPPMRLTFLSQNDPSESWVRIEVPSHAAGSTELEIWNELLDDLQASLEKSPQPNVTKD